MQLGIVSSQVLFRKALCTLLTASGIFAGVVEFDSVPDLLHENSTSHSEVLIIHTTECATGIESLSGLRHLYPAARILFLADDPDEEFGVRALEAGAWGCLSTKETPEVLIKAVEKVAKGERWFGRRVTNAIIDRFIAGQKTNPLPALGLTRLEIAGQRTNPSPAMGLTPREWEVLALVAQGHSDKEVANTLFITTGTAHSHLRSIYRKLQVSTRRAAAVSYFKRIRRGGATLGEPPEEIAGSGTA